MEEEPMKIPVEAVLKWYKKKTDKKISELQEEIGELKAYITELEDEDNREIRVRCKAERKINEDYTNLLQINKKLRDRIKVLNKDKEELLMKLNKEQYTI